MIIKNDIISCLDNPEYVQNISAHELHELLLMYPYCEALHIIYLRKLFIDNDVRFEQQLSDSSMHISNRKLFYNYLHYEQAEQVEEKEMSLSEFPVSNIDYFSIEANPDHKKTLQELAKKLKEARLARTKEKEKKQEEAAVPEFKEQEVKQKAPIVIAEQSTDYYDLGISNDFANTLEGISALARTINVDKTETIQVEEKVIAKKSQITLESLISDDPNLADNTDTQEAEVKILVKEKKYLEALQILRSINLINPKKSAYFAIQIRYLETILENNQ